MYINMWIILPVLAMLLATFVLCLRYITQTYTDNVSKLIQSHKESEILMTNRFQTLEQIAQDLNNKTEQLASSAQEVLKKISAPIKVESKHVPSKQEMRRNNAFNAWNKFNSEEKINEQT